MLDASPLGHVSGNEPPFLLLHGSADPLVSPCLLYTSGITGLTPIALIRRTIPVMIIAVTVSYTHLNLS